MRIFKYKKLTILISFFLLVTLVFAQRTTDLTVISAYGGDASSTSFTLSHTLGEQMIETFDGTSGNFYLTQGFHQNTSLITKVIKDDEGTGVIYPNPTRGTVYIDALQIDAGLVRIDLIDITGKVVKVEKMDLRFSNSISLDELESGIYLLRITDTSGKLIQTSKIEKTQ